MAESTIYRKCLSCGGDGLRPEERPEGSAGAPSYACPQCNGTGRREMGTIDLSDLEDAIADVLDKCNDILDKCNDILEKVNEQHGQNH